MITKKLWLFALIKLAVILLAIVALFFIFNRERLGFCDNEWRFLSDEELIEKAVDEALWRYPEYIGFSKDKTQYKPAYPIYYKSKEEFYAENPNCCSIGYRKNGSIYIDVRHKVKYLERLDSSTVLESKKVVPIALSNCGKAY